MTSTPDDAPLPYDRERFASLREDFLRGALSREKARLPEPPKALSPDDGRLVQLPSTDAEIAELAAAGEAALRAGEVATLILNGGLATRFGGVVKGVVPAIAGEPSRSFLALKLADVHALGERLDAKIPAVVMCSFATREASDAHLAAIEWSGIAPAERLSFDQSVLPRIDLQGAPLYTRENAAGRPLNEVFAAPGHGDTLEQVVASGVVERLRERGVRHVLISNVDNLGATLDPMQVGLHLAAADEGAQVSVEVVRRSPGDVGGCIAEVDGRPVIVEGFRLPSDTDPTRYGHFNTNTLWLTIDALGSRPPLTYFPVQRSVDWDGESLAIVQFERLIGQITEFASTAYVEVDRARRFMPIKTRDDLAAAQPWIQRHVERSGR
ncbi:UTP--glucose-1-phosphate uridylyltransferase [Pseudenhygromyxa sp. WMMC2535]|uniref:UTP--glucose-1-phosphate uridylyltransferase n=1 Tax=Pseudenhygromyxa sp. WMMC2535 TaxID=2712867 RepID=UPI001552F765|nr:UTP--glucose-1-phosphate uridylyltransferase [Pseudenhygromyxa sp. WMMC2535]NVB40051.1 UTP--glucose-1-phosphate uridylyltransferase [Pseudenhygromyxa sp. WMMC2535]